MDWPDVATLAGTVGGFLGALSVGHAAYTSARRRKRPRELPAAAVTREEHEEALARIVVLEARVTGVEAWYRREVLAYQDRKSRPG